MKTRTFLIAVMVLFYNLQAQKWEKEIFSISGKQKVKTIRLNSATKVTVKTLFIETDSFKVIKTYNGLYSGISGDTMKLSLNNYSETKNFTNGMRHNYYFPGKTFLGSESEYASIPLNDIHHLSYINKTRKYMSEVVEPAVFIYMFAIAVTPFLCINYQDWTFNSNRFKYYGLGTTISLAAIVGWGATLSTSRKFQFKTGWPDKNKKVWSFTNETR